MEIHCYLLHADRTAYILEGKNACSPDDVGGSDGFQHMLDVSASPTRNLGEWKSYKDWMPRDYDSKVFYHNAELRVWDYLRAISTFRQMLGENGEE